MRRLVKVHLFLLLMLLIPVAFVSAQQYAPPKTNIEGALDDWGNGTPYDPSGSHLYDNEKQLLDNSAIQVGLVPPGGDSNAPGGGDNPLDENVVDPSGVPMGNGFNIVSLLTCYDPGYQGGTYWVGIDLPGGSNSDISESFRNEWAFNNLAQTWYPLPFDADCNMNRTSVDFPASIIDSQLSDTKEESYTIELYVGGEDGKGYFDKTGRYTGPGFEIYIQLEMNETIKPNILETTAIIPGAYTLNSLPIDLKVLGLFTQSDPHNANPNLNQYDVEVEINGLIDQIWPLIDPTKVGYSPVPMTKLDMTKFYINCIASSLGDLSNEETVDFADQIPPLPFVTEVEKNVFIGECGQPEISSTVGDKEAVALPGTDVKFFLTITVPQDNPPFSGNGLGFIHGTDDLTEIVGNTYVDWELCDSEITVDGVPNLVSIPDFDLIGSEWVIVEKANPIVPYLFDPTGGDIEIVIPFRVSLDPNFSLVGNSQDLLNTVESWGDNGMTTTPPSSSTSTVDILIPGITCYKEVMVTDAQNVTYGPGQDVFVPDPDPSPANYPLTVEYLLRVTNVGETRVHFAQDSLTDDCLCAIAEMAALPFCNGVSNTAQDVDPGNMMDVPVTWIINDYNEYLAALAAQQGLNCGPDPAKIGNLFTALGEVVTDYQPSAPGKTVFIGHTGGGNVVSAFNPDCESGLVTLEVEVPPAVIAVEKTVSCDPEAADDPKKALAIPGADVIWTLKISNVGLVPCTVWFTDTLAGVAFTNSTDFTIVTPGFTITPPVFTPDGTKYEFNELLPAGEEIVMTFKTGTNPNYTNMGMDPEFTNTLFAEADGPDPDVVPETNGTDFAEVNILVPSIFCTKEVTVFTDINGANTKYGPQQSITNIPRTDAYPWDVLWTIEVTNDGETHLDATITDALLENVVGTLQLPKNLNIAPGDTETINVNEIINDFLENVNLDTNDVDGYDGVVHNEALGESITVDPDPPTGDHLCHTYNNGNLAPSYNQDDISCDADYNVPAPCGEIAIVEKLVACDQQGPYAATQAAVPGAPLFFKFTVENPSLTVPLEHAYVEDTLTGEWTSFQAITPNDFKINEMFDLGPLDAGQQITVIYQVVADPTYNTMGVPLEIFNSVEAWADGPDADADPDSDDPECNNAHAGPEESDVNIVIPDLSITKVGTVFEGGNVHGPSNYIVLPDTVTYPIQIVYDIQVENTGEVTLPNVIATDFMLENIPVGIDVVFTNPPGAPPWSDSLAPNGTIDAQATVTLDDFAEAQLLASSDNNPTNTESIDNQSQAAQDAFDPSPICGTVEALARDSLEVAILIVPPGGNIPALDWYGVMLMILALSGLIVWRTMRQS